MARIRVVLADRSVAFRDAAAHFLATDAAIEVVGQSRCCREALGQATQTRPDFVVTELAPQGNCETLGRLKSLPRAPRVIVLTLDDSPEYRDYVHALGADGCVNKSEVGDQLLPLIHGLHGQGTASR